MGLADVAKRLQVTNLLANWATIGPPIDRSTEELMLDPNSAWAPSARQLSKSQDRGVAAWGNISSNNDELRAAVAEADSELLPTLRLLGSARRRVLAFQPAAVDLAVVEVNLRLGLQPRAPQLGQRGRPNEDSLGRRWRHLGEIHGNADEEVAPGAA